jgi:hypothetical protein
MKKPRRKAGAVNIKASAEYAVRVLNGSVLMYREFHGTSVKQFTLNLE